MKKILTSLTLMLLSCSMVYCQADFRKGYIVKLNGDTLHGYVNFQKASLNSTICNFKRFEIAMPVNYTPLKLKGYGIDGGKQFVSVIFEGKPIFAEYLLLGKTSLVYLVSGKFLAFSANNTWTELKSGKIIDKSKSKEYNSYKEYLKESFNRQELDEVIDNSKLEINSLVNIFKLYNQFSKSTYSIPERQKEKSFINDYSLFGSNKFQVGILGGEGTILFSVKSSDATYLYLSKADYNCSLSPVVGFFLKGDFTKKVPRLSYQADFLYQKISVYGFAKNATNTYLKTYDDIFIKYNALSTIWKLKYSIPISRLKIQPHMGIAFSYRTASDYLRYHEEYSSSAQIVRTYEFNDLVLSKLDIGLNGGFSFEYQLSSARVVQLNFEYIYGNKVIKNPKDNYSSASQEGVKGLGSGILITMGLTL